jgi:hypothetical protein
MNFTCDSFRILHLNFIHAQIILQFAAFCPLQFTYTHPYTHNTGNARMTYWIAWILRICFYVGVRESKNYVHPICFAIRCIQRSSERVILSEDFWKMCQGVCVLEIISNWKNPYYLIYHLARGRNIVKLLLFNFLFLPYFSFVSNYLTRPFCEEPQLCIFSMQNQSRFTFSFIRFHLYKNNWDLLRKRTNKGK